MGIGRTDTGGSGTQLANLHKSETSTMRMMLSGALICAAVLVLSNAQDTPAAPPQPTAPAATGDPNCADKRDCSTQEIDSCIGIYAPYAKQNCARWCGYCQHPDDLNQKCEDKINNCAQYNSDLCTNHEFRVFVKENCIAFCNQCDFRPRYIKAQEAAAGTTTSTPAVTQQPHPNCTDNDEAKCFSVKNDDCFGMYEPWARANCPFRCGFCAVKPACIDEINYCSQYGDFCTNPDYSGFTRQNCRKFCNMCDLPVRPAGQVAPSPGSMTGPVVAPPSSGNTPNKVPGTSGTGSPAGTAGPTNPGATNPGATNGPAGPTNPAAGPTGTLDITDADEIGNKKTYVFQNPPYPLVKGVCFFQGKVRTLNSRWFDGCKYSCTCFDAEKNRVICTDRCTTWNPLPKVLQDDCQLVKEADDCCSKFECNVDK